MARLPLTVQEVAVTGLSLAADAMGAANADGFSVLNDGDKRTFFMCKNGGGSPITLTIQTAATRDGLAVADRTIAVAAGARVLAGPFNPALYNRSDGLIYVDFSGVSSVTFGAYKLDN
jgi:hypothetical protein